MTHNVLIFNSQAAGDCLLGTHTARLYKRIFPDSKIYFATRFGLTASTSEFENEVHTLLDLLAMQDDIDGVGYVSREGEGYRVAIRGRLETISFHEIIEQHSWFSNLGIVRSQSYSLFEKHGSKAFSDTDTKFNVGSERQLPKDRLAISVPGPLDWNRKTKNEQMRIDTLVGVSDILKKHQIPAHIRLIGRDVEDGDLIEGLQRLNNSHLYLGPIGLPAHAAAGLGLDTITITSVYPAEYDSPEFYHSGWHRAVAKPPTHCKNYLCVTPKNFPETITPEGPRAMHGFWTKRCEVTPNKLSCVTQTRVEDILALFEEWVVERGIKYLNANN